MKVKFLSLAAFVAGCVALVPAYACTGSDPLTCHGVTYTLTGGAPTKATVGYTDTFTLQITGINATWDTEGGRYGIESVAFNKTNGFLGAMGPSGFTEHSGGLSSGGCGGGMSSNFFCFENTSAIAQSALGQDSSLTFDFSVSAWTAADLTGWDPDFKIAWDGSKSWGCSSHHKCDTSGFHSGYDLVSHSLPPKFSPPAKAPEIDAGMASGALTLLAGGLALVRGRRRQDA